MVTAKKLFIGTVKTNVFRQHAFIRGYMIKQRWSLTSELRVSLPSISQNKCLLELHSHFDKQMIYAVGKMQDFNTLIAELVKLSLWHLTEARMHACTRTQAHTHAHKHTIISHP